MPSAFVERADGRRWQDELVGEEHQLFAGLWILEADAPEAFGIILPDVEAVQSDGLIAYDASRAVRWRRVNSMRIHVRLGSRHEEGANLVQQVETDKVHVAAIHDIDGPRLRHQLVESAHIVHLAVGDVDEGWNIAAQIEQGVHLHRRLRRAEVRPRKDRQTEIDRGRVQGVDRIRQLDAQTLASLDLHGGRIRLT